MRAIQKHGFIQCHIMKDVLKEKYIKKKRKIKKNRSNGRKFVFREKDYKFFFYLFKCLEIIREKMQLNKSSQK